MIGYKRMHSGSFYDNFNSTKSIKVGESSKPSDLLDAATARIGDLEHQIRNLHKFINANGLTRSVPPSIRQHMNQQSDAAKILAKQIREAAAEVSERLSDKAMDARKTGVTCDDISAAMWDFLDEVEGVRQLTGGIPIAFDLVMDLGRYSYGCLGDGDSHSSDFGDRPSDSEVDRLIRELAPERRKMEPSWNHEKALESLKEQNKKLKEYGIDGFCENSIKLMYGWEKPETAVVDLTFV
ncbi:MAG: hypothetical protein Q9221_007394 [Calogaya cf. arnoldii]